MKKKLLLGILAATLAFVGLNGVKADGPEINYQVYEDNERINFCGSNGNGYICEEGTNIKYIVTEDDGENDSEVRLTSEQDSSDTFLIDKREIAVYALIKSTKQIKEEKNVYKFDQIEGADSVTYYKETNRFKEIVESSDVYDFVEILNVDFVKDFSDQLTIPSGVTVFGLNSNTVIIKNLVINGILKTDILISKSISGTGKLVLSYRDYGYKYGEGNDKYKNYFHLQVAEILSNNFTIELEEAEIAEGMPIAHVYNTFGSHDNDKNMLPINAARLNKNTSQFTGYKFSPKIVPLSNSEDYYIVLAKDDSKPTSNTSNNAETKKTVKNPKTGDTLFKILGAITLAGAGFVVTIKKAKQK